MKPIAVITCDINSTIQWLRNVYGVDEVVIPLRLATNTKTGQRYVLILDKQQAYGYEFSKVIISPFYESLEQVARSRIR